MSAQIKLTGGKAVAAIAAVIAVVAFQFIVRSSTLDTEAAAQIKLHLAADYARHHLPEIQRAAQSPSAASVDEVTEMVATIDPENIDIVSISARGSGDDIVARVEVEVNGGDPPDGRRVHYFKMRYSSLTSWTVRHSTTALSYYLKLL
jgi:hypothetical protein